ncbi:MAG: hypothetical protein AB7H92_19170, partial [Microbacteriaceae bacterium]
GLIYLANQLAFFRALGNWTKRTATAIAAGLVLLGVRALGGEADASLLELVVTFLGGGAVAAAPVAIAYKLARLGGNGPTQPQAKPGYPMPKVAGLAAALLLALPSPLAAQGVTYTSEGGTRYTVVDASDSVRSWHVDLKEALERAANLSFTNGNRDFWVLPAFRMRVSTTAGALRVDTVWVTIPDTSRPPPVDTVTPPPVDTVTPPPVDTTPPVVVPPDTVAPPSAGRLFVSAERLATWRAMRDGGHYLWQTAASVCPLTGTSGERYGDIGMWCAMVAATNDDAAAATRAIGKLRATDANARSNDIREEFIARVLMLDLVAPWLTPADRAAIDPALSAWAAKAPGLRLIDSDAVVGEGCGALLWDRLNGRQPAHANITTTLSRYVTAAAGGQWIESSQYNVGTLALLSMCNEAHRTATGADVVPGVSGLLVEAGFVSALEVTPDFRQAIQWGDDQYPRDFGGRLYKRLAFLGSATHPQARAVVDSLMARNPTIAFNQLMAYGLFLWRTGLPSQPLPSQVTYVAPGMGHLYRRDGSTLAWAAAHNVPGADHSDFAAPFDVQVYRSGWLLTHPIAYYSPTWGELIPNGAVYGGVSYFADRSMSWADSGSGWAAIAGAVRGKFGLLTGWPPPPDFLLIGHRVTVLATVGGEPVVIVRDSVAMVDPRSPGYGWPGNYRENATYPHQSRITEFDGAPWAIWHTPTQAAIAGNRATWTATTGEPVSLWWDGSTAITTVDETGLFAAEVVPAEKRWQLRLRHGGVLWQVWSTGTPSVTRSGDTITVGGRSWTITSAGVTGP